MRRNAKLTLVASFYFYDLETSGINPRSSRIMQFGGQRTDLNLKPLGGQPDNILIKLTGDVLPDPEAVLVHGITPQQTHAEGLTEAQFAHFFSQQVSTKGTTVVGFNNIRFDDEFIRFLLWRNFTDAYEWSWQDGCSRWDLLDVVRMTRALRPDGIKWPFDTDGQASNKLELLASLNQLEHSLSHDALSDVKASLAVAAMIHAKQPKLFDYLFNLRNKAKIEALVSRAEPLIYTSGRYPNEFEKTTIAVSLGARHDRPGALMYDLRVDPTPFLKMTSSEIVTAWQYRPAPGPFLHNAKAEPQFPVKILSYNKCPAIAPLSVLDQNSASRLKLDLKLVKTNLGKLQKAKNFAAKLNAALAIIYPPAQPSLVVDEQKVDEQLYDGFVSGVDKIKMSLVRAANSDELANLEVEFSDERLKTLLPLYKARNFPDILNQRERTWWLAYRTQRLGSGGQSSLSAQYFKRIAELSAMPRLDKNQRHLLKELNLYGRSILPKS